MIVCGPTIAIKPVAGPRRSVAIMRKPISESLYTFEFEDLLHAPAFELSLAVRI